MRQTAREVGAASTQQAGVRVLGLFWAVILVVAAVGAGTLQWLGPLPPRPAAAPGGRNDAPATGTSAAARSNTGAAGSVAPSAGAIEANPAPAGPSAALPPQALSDRIAPPDPALQETLRPGQEAPLPRIGPDGRLPMRVYARPFDTARETRPRVGLLLAGIGLSDGDSRAAIEGLPGGVTFAVSAYARLPAPLLELARARGHEFLVSIPMESQGYPLNDSGQRALLTGAAPETNDRNLTWALTRVSGYVGATGAADGLRGERYASFGDGLARIAAELGTRGLLYIDPRPGAEVPAGPASRTVDLVVDDPPARAEIEAKLVQLERLARERGSALGLAGPLRPVTVERLAAWARSLDGRGLALAPVSALVSPPTTAQAPAPSAAASGGRPQRGH